MILVTGASGFLGRHLIRAIVAAHGPDEVVAYTRDPIEGIRCVLHGGYTAESVRFVDMGLGELDVVIHAGAAMPKRAADVDSPAFAEASVRVTKLLLGGQLPSVSRIVLISSVDVYEAEGEINEQSRLLPRTLYGYSKLACEELVAEWADRRGAVAQILRLGHVYGPGEERFEKVIPATMLKILAGRNAELFGDGQEQRSFIYVDDVVNAILAARNLSNDLGPINVAGDRRVRMVELLEMLVEVSETDAQILQVPSSTVGRDVVVDTSKRRKYLLTREIDLLEGLSREWRYMKKLQS